MKERLAETMRNMVRLTFGGAAELSVGASRFGGAPDVPADFIWPRFRTDTFEDDRVKERPLSFLAQFNCREMSAWDTEGLLPKTGLLAFFYECSSQRWGFDPTDRGCARVFWFEDLESLQPAAFPADLPEEYRFPALGVRGSAGAVLARPGGLLLRGALAPKRLGGLCHSTDRPGRPGSRV